MTVASAHRASIDRAAVESRGDELEEFIRRGAAAQAAADTAVREHFKDLGAQPTSYGVARGLALDAQAKVLERECEALQAELNRKRGEAKRLKGEAYKAFTDPEPQPVLFPVATPPTPATPGNNGQQAPPPPSIDPAPGRLGAPEASETPSLKAGDEAFSQLLGVNVLVEAVGREQASVLVDAGVGPKHSLALPLSDLQPPRPDADRPTSHADVNARIDGAMQKMAEQRKSAAAPVHSITTDGVRAAHQDLANVLRPGETLPAEDLELSEELLERAFAGSEIFPMGRYGPVTPEDLELDWTCGIGKALHLDVDRHYAIVMVAHESGGRHPYPRKLYTLHPVINRALWRADMTGGTACTFALRRRGKDCRNLEPEDVPLRGVMAFDREGVEWIFLDDKERIYVEVKLEQPAPPRFEPPPDDQVESTLRLLHGRAKSGGRFDDVGTPMIDWLIERGLVERKGGGAFLMPHARVWLNTRKEDPQWPLPAPPVSKVKDAGEQQDPLAARMYAEGPADADDAHEDWSRGGPLQQLIPDKPEAATQSWFQWAPNLRSAIVRLARERDVAIPADPAGREFDIYPNDFWASFFLRGLKARDAAEEFVKLLLAKQADWWQALNQQVGVQPKKSIAQPRQEAAAARKPAARTKRKRADIDGIAELELQDLELERTEPRGEDGWALGLKPEDLDGLYSADKIGGEPTPVGKGKAKPPSVKAIEINGRLYTCTGISYPPMTKAGQRQGDAYDLVPLYTVEQFLQRFADKHYLHRLGGIDTLDDHYAGVHVTVRGKEYVMGPRGEERKICFRQDNKAKAKPKGGKRR